MPHFLCVTCGTQYAEAAAAPAHCPICDDERQYVPPTGQAWTTLEELRKDRRNDLWEEEPRLTSIRTEPQFAIGQRALLVRTPEGNVLWDCISLLDEATVAAVKELGGVSAIGISHPHYYSSMVEWSRAFDAPVYLHAADRQWVQRPDPALRFWEGETQPLPGALTMIRCGGHFEGGCVLHWPAGAEARGALLTGDIIQYIPDRRFVSFMYSYPNLIPLNAPAVRRIVAAVEPYAFDRIYSAWRGSTIPQDAKGAVHRSAERYLRAISEGVGESTPPAPAG